MVRLYTLMRRGGDMDQNKDKSPPDGRVAINITACAQKSWKRTYAGSDLVTTLLHCCV